MNIRRVRNGEKTVRDVFGFGTDQPEFEGGRRSSVAGESKMLPQGEIGLRSGIAMRTQQRWNSVYRARVADSHRRFFRRWSRPRRS